MPPFFSLNRDRHARTRGIDVVGHVDAGQFLLAFLVHPVGGEQEAVCLLAKAVHCSLLLESKGNDTVRLLLLLYAPVEQD